MSQIVSPSGAENQPARGAAELAQEDGLGGLESAYTGFSCPYEPFDEPFTQMIAGEHARSVLEVFIKQFGGALARSGGGLDAVFSELLATDLPFELAWSSDLGNLYGATRLGEDERGLKAAAAFALMAGARGFPCEWELSLAEPTALLWDDWALPECDVVGAVCDGAVARLTLSTGGGQRTIPFRWRADGRGWECEVPGQAARLPAFGSGVRRLTLLPGSAALSSGFFRDPNDAASALETFSPAVMETLTSALDLLERHIPHYFEWVMRVIRRVVVLHSEQDLLRSGSHENQYGTIHISDNLRVLSVAEMFVHEASHQYLELLRKLGPTVDPSHKGLYYSPVKQCDRPLPKILLAYHAFANVMLYYRELSERGLADDYFDNMRDVLADELRQLELPLVGGDAITPIGRALVNPLIGRGICQ
jgi:HEXXH motif-containing protein